MLQAGTDATSARRAQRLRRLTGVYAVTPDLPTTSLLVARVEAALAGGARAIQYRNKTADGALQAAQAAALARVAQARGALCIVNDDAALAASVGADGVHLGEDDGDVAEARARVGADALIGVSCYNDFARAEAALAAGADYVAFGSFYPSSVKPGARRAGLELLHRARPLGVPVVAIGGINASNAGELKGAGADAIAVISAIFDAGDLGQVERAAREVVAAFDA